MAAQWGTAWITGASTGIGRELAIRLAGRGVTVAASARSAEKLADLAGSAPGITAVPLDVTDGPGVIAAYERMTAEIGPIDLAILNAGVWDPMGAADYDAVRAAHTMAVNYGGLANALAPVLPAMRARGKGHIAIVASVAGYRGLPKAIAYGPSKAAAISLAEVLRVDLAGTGIVVSLVNPGFVETPMTAVNEFPMPFIIGAGDAADRIIRGLERRKFEIAFPWQLVWTLKLMRIMPYPLYFPLVARMMRGA